MGVRFSSLILNIYLEFILISPPKNYIELYMTDFIDYVKSIKSIRSFYLNFQI